MKVRIPNASENGIPQLKHIQEPLQDSLEICVSENEKQKKIGDTVLKYWNLEQAQNTSLRNLIETAEYKISKGLLTPSDDISKFYFAGDTFNNSLSIDSTSTVILDKEAGYIILPIEEIESLNPYISQVRVLPESEGRPGDLVSIKALSFDKDNNPLPQILNDPKEKLEECFDNRPDTWFTWEKVFVKRNQKVKKLGPNNALVFDTNGVSEDLIKSTGGFGLKWKGLIPGQGEKEKDLYTFYSENEEVSKNTKLVLEFKFSSPVPLSTIRITPLIESKIPEPKVVSIQAFSDNGGVAIPPGLPRKITSLSGKEISVSKVSSISLGKANFNGSGVFQIKSNSSLINTVRIELSAEAVRLPLGVAHPFRVKNSETTEKTFILGIKASGKTKRGQDRVDYVNPSWNNIERFKDSNIFTGLLNDVIQAALTYRIRNNQVDNSPVKQLSTSDLKLINTKDKGLNDVGNQTLNSTIENKVGNTINILNQAARNANTLKTVLGKSLSTKLALGGPVGIIAAAALAGSLYNKQKTVVENIVGSSDIFDAERAAIALRDIVFDNRVYSETADLYSEIIELPGKARSLSLMVQVETPNDWPAGDWISTQIKPIYEDEDSEWSNIKAIGSVWKDDPASEILQLKKPTSKVKVRISLKRPSDALYKNQSPILTSYVVKGLPE